MNRNSGEYSLFDGYFGASTSCTSETYAGPGEYSEPETRNEKWVTDTFPNIKFSNNIHSYGGYFMWAPGSYKNDGFRTTAPAPNIGIENYFFEAGEKILKRIKDSAARSSSRSAPARSPTCSTPPPATRPTTAGTARASSPTRSRPALTAC